MKKLTLISVFLLLISTSLFAQNQLIDTAKEILKAYKTKDVALLKKHASGVLKYAITESYFDDDNVRENLKAVENWDGKIRGIGYKSGKMMGKEIKMAYVYFADVPNTDSIYEILLSNYNNQDWVMFGLGLDREKKSEFEKLNVTALSDTTSETAKTGKEFSIEMANGNTLNNITPEKITQCFNSLNDENFYIILNHNKDFLQAAYSDKGYTVEYKENGVQYSANDLLSKENAIALFNKYLNMDKNWNKDIKWEKQ
ncbi:hypothetical protein DRP44_07025 [candidate division TA06 bacterium]|uniref:Uncharacterized protein n=1 Tax=candidate division TA06 bacterium TaxID=2250710 RepID=A0A660S667_UNCT6|nr:MAG: hypothetical protein DRP44_07025 [candidate division TA06 bacterium]